MPYNAYPKLDAVNRMLAAIGEEPVNSLLSGADEAENAERTLDEISRQVQAKGWHCNTDEKLQLTADGNGEYAIPTATLSIDTSGDHSNVDVTIRNGKLYDKENQTSVFTQTTLTCRVVSEIDFEDLPWSLANYIAARASAIFQKRFEGSQVVAGFNSEEEQQAWIDLNDDESVVDDANILYDCASVNDIVYRNNRIYGRRG